MQRILRRRFCFPGQNHLKTMGFDGSTPLTRPQLKARYAALVKLYHPDLNKGDSSMFKAVQRAYEALDKELSLREKRAGAGQTPPARGPSEPGRAPRSGPGAVHSQRAYRGKPYSKAWESELELQRRSVRKAIIEGAVLSVLVCVVAVGLVSRALKMKRAREDYNRHKLLKSLRLSSMGLEAGRLYTVDFLINLERKGSMILDDSLFDLVMRRLYGNDVFDKLSS